MMETANKNTICRIVRATEAIFISQRVYAFFFLGTHPTLPSTRTKNVDDAAKQQCP
jgi:hypothetical protein